MTAKPSLFEKIEPLLNLHGLSPKTIRIKSILSGYEDDMQRRIDDLERTNQILANRLQKLMEKKK